MTGLVLAGTHEARVICDALAAKQVPALASLAGATRRPATLAIETRIGGFGGASGFRTFLNEQGIRWVIDATHPFASQMTKTAAQVCAQIKTPHVIVQRPGWEPVDDDNWHFVDRVAQLNALIEHGATVFLGTGRQVLPEYHSLTERKLLCRVIDEPTQPFPFEGGAYLVGRPPFSVQEEVELFKKHKVDWLVVKNSGGSGGISKLIAARILGLPVAMLNRPNVPDACVVTDTDQALNWLKDIGA